MKKTFLTLVIAIVGYGAYAQTNTFPSSGNVGIGTTSPSGLLHIKSLSGTDNVQITKSSSSPDLDIYSSYDGSDDVQTGSFGYGVRPSDSAWEIWERHTGIAWHNLFAVETNGNVGIGTTSPLAKLDVSNGIKFGNGGAGSNVLSPNNAYVYIGQTNLATEDPESSSGYFFGINPRMGTDRILAIEARTNDGVGAITFNTYSGIGTSRAPERMRITSSGNVLIGKTSQTNTGYIFDVNGSARANEVVVNTTGADFVFKPTYNLPKLSEVKSYIDVNHHLPEIPSAEQMKKDGMSVGEMNTKLLQKVEELTLYLIEQQKQMDQLKQKEVALETTVAKLINKAN